MIVNEARQLLSFKPMFKLGVFNLFLASFGINSVIIGENIDIQNKRLDLCAFFRVYKSTHDGTFGPVPGHFEEDALQRKTHMLHLLGT